MQVMSIFPSGRIVSRKDVDEKRAREFAEEFPTIIYTLVESSA